MTPMTIRFCQALLHKLRKNYGRLCLGFTSIDRKFNLARDLATDSILLELLAHDRDYRVRYCVTQLPNCSITQLPNCSIPLLEKLATDDHLSVRYWVSQHPNCPEYIKTYIVARNFIEHHHFINLHGLIYYDPI